MDIAGALGAAVLALTVVGGVVWLFFLVHAMQRLESPYDRAQWLLVFLAFTVLAVPLYVMLRYRAFLRQGQGALIRNRARGAVDGT